MLAIMGRKPYWVPPDDSDVAKEMLPMSANPIIEKEFVSKGIQLESRDMKTGRDLEATFPFAGTSRRHEA